MQPDKDYPAALHELSGFDLLLAEMGRYEHTQRERFEGARDEHLAADNRERCRDIQNPV